MLTMFWMKGWKCKSIVHNYICCGFFSVEQVDDELEIKAYYAGHVLGAAMFHMKVGTESLVYTVSAINMFVIVF